MTPIIAPVTPESSAASIANLQDGLLLLLGSPLLALSVEESRNLQPRLAEERARSVFADATIRLLNIFQAQSQISVVPAVDERSADALNAALRRLGAFDIAAGDSLIVSGRVINGDQSALAGATVRAFHAADSGSIRLGEDITDDDGRYTIRYQTLPGVTSISLQVNVTNRDGTPIVSSVTLPGARSLEVIDLAAPLLSGSTTKRRIEGRVIYENGLGASGLKLRLFRHLFGAAAPTMLQEIAARAEGLYTFEYDASETSNSFEIRALDTAGTEVPLSEVLHGVQDAVFYLNLAAPASLQPQDAEFARMSAAISPHVGAMNQLAGAQENSQRQDFTLLSASSGWDARLIALAAKAARVSAESNASVPQDVLYGLFRAGLPSDTRQLATVSGAAVEQALDRASSAGIVTLSAAQRDSAKAALTGMQRDAFVATPLVGSRSNYASMLEAADLSAGARDKFLDVYLKHEGNADQLWSAVGAAGVEAADIRKLQTQGKLAFLTHSLPVMQHLQGNLGIQDPAELVSQGFYEPARWQSEIQGIANGDAARLKELIPPGYTAETAADNLGLYSQDMARQVRISYPTQVVTHRIESDPAKYPLSTETEPVVAVLKDAAAKGFRLGETPFSSFLLKHPEIIAVGVSDPVAVQQGVEKIQRIYQMTPSDAAMPVLLKLGFTSALDVVKLTRDEFLTRHAHEFPTREEAELIYRKAEQISSVTYNLFTIARKLQSDPPLHGVSAPEATRKGVRNELIKQFPTLESLFGSMDYCECEHCRSVLSPAAYLVDLLQFIDTDPPVWNSFLADWKQRRGTDYTAKFKKPYDALLEKRPDLPHVALTCENTHTAMPYIDIVNEILEYYVANDALAAAAARDTGEASTEELLAEPQNVIAGAYDKLLAARYPLTLPFDLWLESVRAFARYFETPLADVLETFRASDELFAPTQPYDRAMIAFESLGLSSADAAIFNDPDPLAGWFRLYGVNAPAGDIPDVVDSTTGEELKLDFAKPLSRRLGVTYKELIAILETEFVNPDLSGLVLLRQLGLDIRQVQVYREHRAFYDANADLIGADRAALSAVDLARYDTLTSADWDTLSEIDGFEQRLKDVAARFPNAGIDPKAWLLQQLAANAFDQVLVLSDVQASVDFDFAQLAYGFRANAAARRPDALAFLRINLFVRLWRKLGWSIEETDRALAVFLPKGLPFQAATPAQAPLRTALIHLARFNEVDTRLALGKQSRIRLLALWAPLASSGKNPLYAQLFLQPGVLSADAVFDDPLGRYLHPDAISANASTRVYHVSLPAKPADAVDAGPLAGNANVALEYDALQEVQHLRFTGLMTDGDKAALLPLSASPVWPGLLDAAQASGREFGLVRGHIPALQGALSLTADEIADILERGVANLDSAALTLDNLSLLYRYGLLARALKRPVRDLITLIDLTGLDPFTPVPNGALEGRAQDALTTTLEFLRVSRELEDSGFTVPALDYLLRHIDQGTQALNAGETLLRPLHDGIAAIRAELVLPTDAASLTDEQLGQWLGQMLPLEQAARAVQFLDGRSEAAARTLFDEQLIAQPGRGFLVAADFDLLFKPLEDHVAILPGDSAQVRADKETQNEKIDAENLATHQARRLRMATAVLETLERQRVRQFILESLTAWSGAERAVVEALATDATLLGVVEGATTQPLIDRFDGDSAADALLRLGKALRLVQGLGLNLRELRYLCLRGGAFNGLDLATLPVARLEDGKPLFARLSRLMAYARAKRALAQGSDALIGLFESAAAGDAAHEALAKITRRKASVLKPVAKALGLTPPFTDERSLEILANGLALVDRFGLPVAALLACTRIVNGKGSALERQALARDLKSAIKARFEPDAWQRVAQPIFDALRQRQRDALCAYIMHKHGFDQLEQLYDYFLIDPGMEPVVQTSRIRLATASVQLFIQRCLLNLEKFVDPSAICSSRWEWMKAYRVWEANRKIFLFPENWLEPEFRDDKTHLFRELEGKLLQGDVTNDLIEDAMLEYLRKLNELARLDIVAMHLEERVDPAMNTLHVIGRTHGEPHKYFYRTYAHQMWTPWEPITADIDGDHLAPVIWKDRLFLFWVTFLEVPARDAPPSPGADGTIAAAKVSEVNFKNYQMAGASQATASFAEPVNYSASPGKKTPSLTEMSLSDLSRGIRSSVSSYVNIQVQLHWSEYVRGKWSTRETTGAAAAFYRSVPFGFSPDMVSIHVAKQKIEEGDGAVYVHLGGPINRAFMLAGRNSTPQQAYSSPLPLNRYSAGETRATRLAGSGNFNVTYTDTITTEDGKAPVSAPSVTQALLKAPEPFTILACNNELSFPTAEIASLIKPLFFQDNTHTFFIEPDLEERTLEEVKEWVIRTPQPGSELPKDFGLVPYIPPKYYQPKVLDPRGPVWQQPFDKYSKFEVAPGLDWMVNPGTGVLFDGEVIGPGGRASMSVLQKADAVHAIEHGASPVAVQPGVELPFDVSLVDVRHNGNGTHGMIVPMDGQVTLVGATGFNATVLHNVTGIADRLAAPQGLAGMRGLQGLNR